MRRARDWLRLTRGRGAITIRASPMLWKRVVQRAGSLNLEKTLIAEKKLICPLEEMAPSICF